MDQREELIEIVRAAYDDGRGPFDAADAILSKWTLTPKGGPDTDPFNPEIISELERADDIIIGDPSYEPEFIGMARAFVALGEYVRQLRKAEESAMTTNADVMAELIEKLEGLTGPDRVVDWQIQCRNGLEGVGMYGDHPHYTSSVDAARTLVPPHHQWSGGSCNEDDQPWACVTGPESEGCVDFDGDGANEAIALLIAIFKARTAQASAASVGTEGEG